MSYPAKKVKPHLDVYIFRQHNNLASLKQTPNFMSVYFGAC